MRHALLALAAAGVLLAGCIGGQGEAPPEPCAEPTTADCILAVYTGAPVDDATAADIPESALIPPDAHGRYHVERGQQVTVVTAASLPEGYDRFSLRQQQVDPSPVAHHDLAPPPGTTYTFTVAADERRSSVITFDLTAARPPSGPGPTPQLGDAVVTTTFLIPTLRYDREDPTGAVATAGSYAFFYRPSASEPARITHPTAATEIRIHPTDASGTSRAAFFDLVKVGDMFDYRTHGLDRGDRYRVTRVADAELPRTFGVEFVADYRRLPFGPSGEATDVEFVWGVRWGLPGPDGVRVIIGGEPTGPGTYRLSRESPYVADIPAGMRVIVWYIDERWILAPPRDLDWPYGPSSFRRHAGSQATTYFIIHDVATGSFVSIDSRTGAECLRGIVNPHTGESVTRFPTSGRSLVDARMDYTVARFPTDRVGILPAVDVLFSRTPVDGLFDQIVASIRQVPP